MIILCDIDNVISDDEWRIGFINREAKEPRDRYHAYNTACPLDSAANLHLLRPKEKAARVILLTAMSEEYAPLREKWLADNKIRYERILYRIGGDNRRSVDVKFSMVQRLGSLGYNLSYCVAAIDDRPEVVAMYERLGLPALRVAINERP